jgi:tripeptide aminopeptidase
MNRQRLLNRFLQYVRIDTTANEQTSNYPSTPGQLELGRLLLEQLRELGLADAGQNAHGIVTATVPGNLPGAPPVVAFNAHVDTSPETTGAGVQPQVIENYSGGDLVLPGDPGKVISVAGCPELAACLGHTLITTDGTTLLGADDKAGLAIIMELAQHLLEHPEIPHGPVRLLFTCDEEIGRGTQHVDLEQLGATVCYTFDGGGANQIDHETFSADLAVVTVKGVNIHPSIAKDRMINAVRVACRATWPLSGPRGGPVFSTRTPSKEEWPKSCCAFCCGISKPAAWRNTLKSFAARLPLRSAIFRAARFPSKRASSIGIWRRGSLESHAPCSTPSKLISSWGGLRN